MEDERVTEKDLSILLGRPFMATAKTIINVLNGKLSMTVLGETVKFQFTKDELEDLLELERELEEEEKAERHRLGSAEGEDDLETGLGVDQTKQLKVEAKPCRNKPHRLEPNLEKRVHEEEMKLLNMGSIDLISDSKWL
ncbi:hypothetical protein ACOSQ4_022585 [Xanthoceras sorbifolium]